MKLISSIKIIKQKIHFHEKKMEASTAINTKVTVTQSLFFKDSRHINLISLFIYFKLKKLCKPCSVVQCLFIFLKFCN